MPHSRATCVIGRDSVSRIASRRNSSLYAFGPRFFIPHLLPRISIEALEVSTKPGELQYPDGIDFIHGVGPSRTQASPRTRLLGLRNLFTRLDITISKRYRRRSLSSDFRTDLRRIRGASARYDGHDRMVYLLAEIEARRGDV